MRVRQKGLTSDLQQANRRLEQGQKSANSHYDRNLREAHRKRKMSLVIFSDIRAAIY